MNNSFKQKDDVKTEFHTEPVAWITMNGLSYQQTGLNDRPLYTHPAKTLTDEEITELANQHLSAHAQFIGAGECSYEGEIEFARAILKKASEK